MGDGPNDPQATPSATPVPPQPPSIHGSVNIPQVEAAPAAVQGGKFPVAKACPKCDGTDYKKVAPTATMAFAKDRVCKGCGTRYSPPTPMWAAITFIVVGSLMMVFGGLVSLPTVIQLYESGTNKNASANPMGLVCPLTPFILGVLALVQGVRALKQKK